GAGALARREAVEAPLRASRGRAPHPDRSPPLPLRVARTPSRGPDHLAARAHGLVKKKRRPEARAARPPKRATAPPGWLPLALVLAAGAATHAAILRAPFFADDYLFLDQVRARPLVEALLSHDPLGNFLRPVGRQLHFWIWSHASGESPLAFHAVNLIVF